MQRWGHAAGRSRSLTLVVGVAGGMVLASGVGALAAHQFGDVPTGHAFHDEIGAVAGAGITTGYEDGNFRPGADVSRQAVAAFLTRANGRVGFVPEVETVIGNDVDGFGTVQEAALIGTVTIDAGATGDGNGFVLLNGTVTAYTDNTDACPCEVTTILDDADGQEFLNFSYFDLAGQATETGYSNGSDSLQWVVPVGADSTRTFDLYVVVDDGDVAAIEVMGELTGVYVPFGPDGGNDLWTQSDGASSQSHESRSPRSDLSEIRR